MSAQLNPSPAQPALHLQATELGPAVHRAWASQPVVPAHLPPEQVSLPVQPLLSLQFAVLLPNTQPLLASQLSSVHTLPSLQVIETPALQVPAAHVSPTVQTEPSLQGAVLLATWQPFCGSQLSSVHRLPSSHFLAVPGTQAALAQVSPSVHTLPSVQGAELPVWVQPWAMSHAASVQGLPSSQLTLLPGLQAPPAQVSSCSRSGAATIMLLPLPASGRPRISAALCGPFCTCARGLWLS